MPLQPLPPLLPGLPLQPPRTTLSLPCSHAGPFAAGPCCLLFLLLCQLRTPSRNPVYHYFLLYFFFLFFTTWQFFPSYLSPQNCQPQRSAGTLQRDSKCPPDGGMSPGLLLGAHPSQPWPPSCNLGWLKPATKKLLEGVRPGCKHHTALLICSFGLWTASSL